MVKKIGIIRRNGLGDVLCVMPLVSFCRQKYPEAHITLIMDERAEGLIPFLKGPDDFCVIPKRSSKYISILLAAWNLRLSHFDLLISAKGSPMKLMNLFLSLLRAKEKVAYVDQGWHRAFVSRQEICPEGEIHQALKALWLLDRTVLQIPPPLYPKLDVPALAIDLPGPILVVSVTSNRIGSLLDTDKTARILNRLQKKKNFSLIINGEPKDAAKAEALEALMERTPRIMLTSKLEDCLRLIAAADIVFSGDGGVMHLAAALDKNQLVLFGGTKVWEWKPLSMKARCLADPENVNFIPEELIDQELEQLL